MTEEHIEQVIDTWVREPGRAEVTEGGRGGAWSGVGGFL